jgi:WD40 repeat protein
MQALAWSSKGKVATLTSDGQVRLWSSVGDVMDLLDSADEITTLRWNTTGDVLLTLNKASRMQAWDYKGSLKQTFKQTSRITEVDWSNDSEFASGTETGDVLIWSHQNDQPILQIVKAKQRVDLLKWQPGGSRLAWVQGSCLRVWSEGSDISISVSGCSTLDWLGELLVTGHSTGCLNVWDSLTGSQLSTLQPHASAITKLKVRADGEFLATLSGCELAVWSSKHWSAVKRFTAPSEVSDL